MNSFLCKLVFAPLSWLYGLGLACRHALYNKHILPSYNVDVATIGVGNLSVGGTGKTPVVEYLIRLLAPHYKVAVLSRGYKRTTRGFRLATTCDDAATLGDEPMLLHQHFPQIPVAVCKDRVAGIGQLKQLYPDLDCVLLDDAMQYRRLRLGYSILLTAYSDLYCYDHLLPYGRLRDLPQRSANAQTILITKCPNNLQPIERHQVLNAIYPSPDQQLCFSQINYTQVELPGTPLIVTGIAHPEYLFHHTRQTYPQAKLLSFPDHHSFSQTDIDLILQQAKSFKCVLTTEKDLTRLQLTSLVEQLGAALYVQPIEINMGNDADDFNRKILSYVKENAHKTT